ncbi:hypothetical protein HHL16_17180 [Pseudoflavitalea sp. G-6-1-2]|uniref:hypothetical protein n=1 Tax=Pseudoflavitalea sp. G-6-1-2 TaxID=2728841 RepID=UPI00146B439C|nr:hypothetical protein [Pseudoflavitalea sp. G-6-1-2]NML22619.1 hypothetical protein [Pseudoflavitalea sp. G-6-1-2]
MVLYRQHRLFGFFLLLFICAGWGCGKNKFTDGLYEENPLVLTNSNIRLFNISQYDLNLVVNNNLLAMQKRSEFEDPQTSAIGKLLFPSGMWKNKTGFSIPTTLLDKSGGAQVSFPPITAAIALKDTLLINDPVNPRDYYILPTGKMVTFPRNNTPPADPKNFKIRIVNLGNPVNDFNVGGPVTLTYADGSMVDVKLSGIDNNQSSEYAEVPYGAYMFKLFAGGTMPDYKRQLTTNGILPAFNYCVPGIMPQEGYLPPVTTFKPGGVYTIMVVPTLVRYDVSCNGGTSFILQKLTNAYQLITDLDPGVNMSYARINAINTIPGKKVVVKDNGRQLGDGALTYIGDQFQSKAIPAVYNTVVQGNHTIRALDESGAALAELNIDIYPFDNLTFWVYTDAGGKTQITFTSNDMTNTLYKFGFNSTDRPDDGTDGEIRRIRYATAWQSRFMNFCNQYKAVTFSNDGQLFLPEYRAPDSIRYRTAYCNLAPAQVPQRNASVIYALTNITGYNEGGAPIDIIGEQTWFPKKIWVNNTEEGFLPGSIITTVSPVSTANTFTANDAMYSNPNSKTVAETGIYTIALVGGQSGAAPKIVAIKHNK